MKAAQLPEVRRVVAYARVSTEDQAKKNLSLPAQISKLRADSDARGWTVVKEFIDDGETGTDDKRPKFRAMLSFVTAPENDIQAVLVVHTSRFMRDSEKALFWKRDLERRGIRIITPGMD